MMFGTRPHGHHPLLLFHEIHSKFLTQYECKEVYVASQSQFNVGPSTRLSSQNGVSQHQKTTPISLPQLDLLHESSFVSVVNADVVVIPSQYRVTQEILIHYQSFRDLKLMFTGSGHVEQLILCSQLATVHIGNR